MPKFQVVFRPIASLAVLLLVASQASAQATRTWVSGVGDDVNPCSRTAPCKTFAGAISKTADGGEINCIDPGGFGAVTITKSITIDGGGTFASILASGTNGIIINDSTPAGSVVTLRNLAINGAGATPGLNGIRFLNGETLHVENCQIFGFSQNGIDVQPAPAVAQSFKVVVLDTVIRNCAFTAPNNGIQFKPGANGTVTALLDGVKLNQNKSSGVRAEARSTVTVRSSEAFSHPDFGFVAISNTAGQNAVMNLESCVTSNNGAGIRSSGVAATMRISNVSVFNNTNGLLPDGGASIISFVNNRILGNTTNGAPTGTQVQQ